MLGGYWSLYPPCSFPNEIIEWPVVLLRWARKRSDEVEAEAAGEVHDGGEPVVEAVEADEGEEGELAAEEAREGEWMLEVVDEYHSFVKPTWKPKLSAFCTELTAIEQVRFRPPSSGIQANALFPVRH